MEPGDGQQFEDVPEHLNPVALYVWLTVAGGAVGSVVNGRAHPAWLAGVGLAAFAALYVAALWARLTANRPTAAYILLAGLVAVTIALNFGFGTDMAALFPLLAIACGAIVPWQDRPRRPPGVVVVLWTLATVAALTLWARHASVSNIWQVWYSSVLAGFVVALISR